MNEDLPGWVEHEVGRFRRHENGRLVETRNIAPLTKMTARTARIFNQLHGDGTPANPKPVFQTWTVILRTEKRQSISMKVRATGEADATKRALRKFTETNDTLVIGIMSVVLDERSKKWSPS
jgi:hypothetical protein